jgi:hypothetical protein
MRSTLQKKIWKLSANSAFCLVFLSAGLLLLLLDAQFKQQLQIPINSETIIFAP